MSYFHSDSVRIIFVAGNVTCVVVHGEPCGAVVVVLVLPAVVPQLGLEVVVGALLDAVLAGADVVQDGHDAGARALVLDQLTDDGVVEVLDRGPADALLDVLFLEEGFRRNNMISTRFIYGMVMNSNEFLLGLHVFSDIKGLGGF